MNWGKGIAIALIAFMSFILFLAINLMTKSVDLEYEDYYTREVVFQDRIAAEENGKAFKQSIRILQSEEDIQLILPDGFPTAESGEVHFYKPDDAKSDIRIQFTQDQTQAFPITQFKPGRYELRLSWKSGEKEYYVNKTFFVN
jgi:hypothetical protein